jgi:hypothetical protein
LLVGFAVEPKSLELDLLQATGMWFGTTLAQINQKE